MLKKLLQVEDDPGVAFLTEIVFRDEGFEVETIDDGLKAIDILRERQKDLIISDHDFPNGDKFRKFLDEGIDTPVVLVSARPPERIPGFDKMKWKMAYWQKESDVQPLVDIVKNLLK